MDKLGEAVVVLIPKVKSVRVTEFRPINPCNVVYKVVAKMVANSHKIVLDEIISQHQSAFVPRKLITDNMVIGFECIHYLRNKRDRKKGYTALKLDMSKAYDRVEWSFLKVIMERLEFEEGWISLVMKCWVQPHILF
ncbi:hypothetical protein Ddye_026655 [Dipteronia dyeriana]|uniref:Reverse transcriptase domain-containing protein n=1 Tax=Dipteronia dyeriana TaxID=168575 RepID=A0AAD9TNN1_9ROSI|nr:hypothetical protein Ddye_026655 [Dipteronia dyeriana]